MQYSNNVAMLPSPYIPHVCSHACLAPAASVGKTIWSPVLMQNAIYREAEYYDIDLTYSRPCDRDGGRFTASLLF